MELILIKHPVVRHATIWAVLAIAASYFWAGRHVQHIFEWEIERRDIHALTNWLYRSHFSKSWLQVGENAL